MGKKIVTDVWMISWFCGICYFKVYQVTTKDYPKHSLLIGKEVKLKSLR